MIFLPDDKPFISRYRLRARGFLNAVSGRREFDGVLIRLGHGFGCIHPWPELGDPPLAKCLTDLAGPRRWPIVRRALRCVQFDAAAREHEESLFEEMEVPASHATLPAADPKILDDAVAAGFTVVKLKCAGPARAEAAFLSVMTEHYPQIRWRLDFNESATAAEVAAFLTSLPAVARGALDFIEDPCPYEEAAWLELRRQTGVCLAVDREASPQCSAAKVVVIKPAVDEPLPLAEAALAHRQRVILTSYMDHPLGQAFAAWEAARLGLQFPGLPGICGLQTHHLFDPNPFAELLGPWAPAFTPPPGTGLGFDDLLEELTWTRDY